MAQLTCPVCGITYSGRSDKRACSRSCYDQLPDRQVSSREYRARPGYRERKNEQRRTSPQQITRIREYNRIHNLRKYGLTVEDYGRLLAGQGGVCAICGSPPNPDGVRAASRLHPDHDHETGRNRALLCLNCNVGIGHFRDDPDLMQAAADYIKRHRALVAEGSQ